jgi:hypothetical protein
LALHIVIRYNGGFGLWIKSSQSKSILTV